MELKSKLFHISSKSSQTLPIWQGRNGPYVRFNCLLSASPQSPDQKSFISNLYHSFVIHFLQRLLLFSFQLLYRKNEGRELNKHPLFPSK